MSYDYQTYVNTVANILDIPQQNAEPDYNQIIPRMIEYAELRVYRELDFIATLAAQTTTLTASTQTAALPTNIIVPQSFNITAPATGDVIRVGADYINSIYPPGSTTGQPIFCALIGNPTIGATITAGPQNLLFGPIPDQNYTLSILGTLRPSPLSPANTTTFLTTNMPDLFLAASLVFGFGFQRDFGAQSDDPQAAQSWENQYQALKQGVNIEEIRKKAASVSWSPYIPTPQANTQRDRASAAPSP